MKSSGLYMHRLNNAYTDYRHLSGLDIFVGVVVCCHDYRSRHVLAQHFGCV